MKILDGSNWFAHYEDRDTKEPYYCRIIFFIIREITNVETADLEIEAQGYTDTIGGCVEDDGNFCGYTYKDALSEKDKL